MKQLFVVFILLICASLAFAQSNTGTLDQYGSNLGKITQTGASNTGNIDQGAVGMPVSNNHAPAYSGDWIEGAFIKQAGSTNDASIIVHTSGNGSEIEQIGDGNKGYQELGSYYHVTTNPNLMGLDILQEGNGNYANQKTVATFGNFGIQGMLIHQDGNANSTNQLSIGGMAGIMKAEITGDNNNYTVDVSGLCISSPLLLSWTHKPAGSFAQYQYGEYSHNTLGITGNNNHTAQYQEGTTWGGGYNNANIDISGNDNNMAQGQLGIHNDTDFGISGDLNKAASTQWGDLNNANIDISGNSNKASIEQWNNSNIGTVNQVGNSNTGCVIQHGL